MATILHVNGVANIYIGFPGGGLQQLGITESGVDIAFDLHTVPVRADTGGPELPVEMLSAGKSAELSGRLVIWDDTVMDQLLLQGNAPVAGQLGQMGLPLGLTNNSFRVVVTSDYDRPHRLLTCVLRGPQRKRLSTVNTPFDLRIFSWALIGTANNSLATPLYDNQNA